MISRTPNPYKKKRKVKFNVLMFISTNGRNTRFSLIKRLAVFRRAQCRRKYVSFQLRWVFEKTAILCRSFILPFTHFPKLWSSVLSVTFSLAVEGCRHFFGDYRGSSMTQPETEKDLEWHVLLHRWGLTLLKHFSSKPPPFTPKNWTPLPR